LTKILGCIKIETRVLRNNSLTNKGGKMIISFAWTKKTLTLRNKRKRKTVTRRFWKDHYARRFKKGTVHDAYDKDPRYGGKKIAEIQITKDLYKEKLDKMTDSHFKREGGTMYWKNKQEFIKMMKARGDEPWVVEFKVIRVCKNRG
jgi:uncharacterized protein YqfB (UPF0267 family)